ncbi:MAG: Ig-like domain-containing protein [Bacteroidales bacterium]|nr:Ig-like domain-containing protein [Bacteroidales bacterium]
MKLYNNVIYLLIALMLYILGSCANTTTPPTGGIKDTIPPRLLKVIPDSGRVNFPLKGGVIEMKFDEYIVLKEPQKSLFLSPPLEKRVETKIRGKSIIITFPLSLDSSQTYSLNFGNSIVDNNEGNQFYNYVYPFSTGDYIDSLMVSGTILNAVTLLPAEDITIALYKDNSDSVLYNSLPDAYSKSDKFGFFVIRNIEPRPYRVFAFKDNNGNNKYDPENEEVAFLDTLFQPTKILKKGLKELEYVDEKDTLIAMSRPSQLDLYLFRENPDKQFIRESKRLQPRMVYVKFSTPEAEVLSLSVDGADSLKIVKEFNIRRDSLILWFTDTTYKVPDTLKLSINYLKTDSLNNLSPFEENFKLVAPKPVKQDMSISKDRSLLPGERVKRADLLEFDIDANPTLFEEEGFVLKFKAPILSVNRDSLKLVFKTPRGEEGKMPYIIQEDSVTSRIIRIKPQGRILTGYEYSLRIADNALIDIYKHTNDSIVKSVSLPRDEKLSKLILDIYGANGSYIVELTNITRDKIFRSYKITGDKKLNFPYLQTGKYSVKITEDINSNGIIDTGSIKDKRQPEKVRLYTLPDGSSVISIPESAELEQRVDLKQIFNR